MELRRERLDLLARSTKAGLRSTSVRECVGVADSWAGLLTLCLCSALTQPTNARDTLIESPRANSASCKHFGRQVDVCSSYACSLFDFGQGSVGKESGFACIT